MDALDEFFAVWTEPEAWCEICGEYPAIHVVLRDTGGKFGGMMSHIRIWNPNTQTRLPACRHCCQDQMSVIGQSMPSQMPQEWAASSVPTPAVFNHLICWATCLRQRVTRPIRQGLSRLRNGVRRALFEP